MTRDRKAAVISIEALAGTTVSCIVGIGEGLGTLKGMDRIEEEMGMKMTIGEESTKEMKRKKDIRIVKRMGSINKQGWRKSTDAERVIGIEKMSRPREVDMMICIPVEKDDMMMIGAMSGDLDAETWVVETCGRFPSTKGKNELVLCTKTQL